MANSSKDRFLPKKDDDNILSDSDSSIPEVQCDTCGVKFDNIKSYDAHMKGKKHKKKVEQEKLMTNYKKSGLEKDESKSDSESDDDSELYCEVCEKRFSGYGSFVSHLKGSVHAKFMKKQKLKERMSDMPQVLIHTSGGTDDEDEEIIPKPYARCLTCQKEFSGPESFDLHIKSSMHKKKEKMAKTLNVIASKYPEEAKHSGDEDEAFARCDVCKKSFSGPMPYHIHMKSAIHKKAVTKLAVAEEMKKQCESYDPKIGFVCKECKKTFTDPVNFKQHLKNNSHEKQKVKNALKEFLNSYPEIAFTTPFGEQNYDEENQSDSENPEYFLICKICHASFSGPESAQDHVKSKKHLNLKKEKRMLKVLKENGKQSSSKVEKDAKESSGQVKDSNNDVKKPSLKIEPLKSKSNGVSVNEKNKNSAYIDDDFEMI